MQQNNKKSDPVDMANSLQELCQPKKVDLLQRGRLLELWTTLQLWKAAWEVTVADDRLLVFLFSVTIK